MPDSAMPGPGQIRIRINGAECVAAFGGKVSALLAGHGLNAVNARVERNGELLSPHEIRHAILKDGDRLEIARRAAD